MADLDGACLSRLMQIQPPPWSAEHGLERLRRNNVSELMAHLSGPETDEQLKSRHQWYLGRRTGAATILVIEAPGRREGIGVIG